MISEISTIPKQQLKILVDKELSQRSFYYFFQEVLKNVSIYKSTKWEMNWHYEEIAKVLESELRRIIRGEPKTTDLIMTLPYRSGKSTLLECFGAYCWVLQPSLKFLFIASNQTLAIKSARSVKMIIESEWFKDRWSDVVLMHDSKAKGNFSNTLGGQFLAFSVSNATGRGGDIVCVDDACQSSDAYSDTKLRNVVLNYRDGIHSRLNDTKIGLRIICQQRISAKDLVGTLKSTNPQDFREICLPGYLTQDTSPEYRKFYIDNLFWTTRYSLEELQKHKNMLTPTAYASQILQSSSVYEGSYIKRTYIKIVKQSEFQVLNKNKMCLFIDTNLGGNNKNNDPTGLMVCTSVGGRIYVLKFMERWEQLFELCQTIFELIKVWGIQKVYVENAAAGAMVMTELKRQLRGKTIVLGINPGSKSKEERVNAVQPYLINNKVLIVEDDWNTLYMNYLADFNHGKHDEAVDLTVYAILALIAGKNYGGADTESVSDRRGMVDENDYDLYSK